MSAAGPIPEDFVSAFAALGLVPEGTCLRGEALAGGVSSDIWRVDLASGPVCAKRALARLRVKDDWQAPLSRHNSEANFLRLVGAQFPDAVPRIIGHDTDRGVVVMEFLEPERYTVWKAQLRDGLVDPDTARMAADFLARLHARFKQDSETAARFPDHDLIFALRLSPYFEAAAIRHQLVAAELRGLIAQFERNRTTLIHGDFSPKNILVDADARPVLVDAETAAWGDPAFDLAFCLTHLLLKAVWKPQYSRAYQNAARVFISAYFLEPDSELEKRACAYLPGFLLARVDGKSPVEYLTHGGDQEFVRRFSLSAIVSHEPSLQRFLSCWFDSVFRHAMAQEGEDF
jgi:aminoglycoside phosphotransferase (APT) family kinase protein